ncbi:hypothetical protein I6E17_09390 [Fusobacterium perfoetens]|uniref:MAG1210 family protein n=1 Tax=Fusobacterium perfoetens TaxID=852 RepID=UPI001F22FD53|nr:hypothetical protein [Fusobacterium perfoetens]MCF2626367.1 hypothetical protein [Fusobacterium perfoetens]
MEFVDEQEKLLEPLKYYKTEVAKNFLDKLTDNFENLLRKSGIDIEANKKSVSDYNEISKVKVKNEKKLKWAERFYILFFYIFIFLIIYEIGIIRTIKNLYDLNKNIQDPILRALLIGIGAVVLGILNFKYIRGKKKQLNKSIKEIETELVLKKEECYSQVNPLLSLFESNTANKIVTEIIPTLVLDKNFKIERYADLVENFEMPTKLQNNFSTKDIISGEILGNPFIIIKSLCNRVIDQKYTGSLTVSWEETYRDSNGERKTRTVSQTLHASIIKPKQIFEDKIDLIYGNDAAEHLHFSREPKFIHEFSEKKLAKYVKKSEKELKKKTENAIKTGQTFLEMGNSEFDVLFGALNRDNEVEFRVLFTPIAQRNILEVLKDKDFGDDFAFRKINKLNNVSNQNDWILNIDKSYYEDFSYEIIKEKYYDINKRYLNNFYRLFLPILAIPVYHQHKAQKYIYQEKYNYNYNPYTSEAAANLLGAELFSHEESNTPSILKTKTLRVEGDADLIEVISQSYKAVERTEYVPMRAGDGRVYNVPVNWIDYVPLAAKGRMELKKLDIEENEFEKSLDQEFYKSTENKRYIYKNNIFAMFTSKEELDCNKILKNIIKK